MKTVFRILAAVTLSSVIGSCEKPGAAIRDQAKMEDWRADLAAATDSFDTHRGQVQNPAIGRGVSYDMTLKLMDRAADKMADDAKQIVVLLQKKPFGLPLSQTESELKARMERYIGTRTQR